jgi:tetratricopeptide (TPR) repeat protein
MEEIAATIAHAAQCYQAGDLCRAEQSYHQVLEADPTQVDALHGLSAIAYQRGEYGQAVDWLRRAVAVQEANPVLHTNLGAAHEAAGQPAEAEACYRRALRLNPEFAEAYNNLANILKTQGKLDEAVARYHQALLARPHYAEAHNNLGLALWEQGQAAEALDQFQQATLARPDWAEAYGNWGRLLREQGRLEEAIVHLRQALALSPGEPQRYADLMSALQEQASHPAATAPGEPEAGSAEKPASVSPAGPSPETVDPSVAERPQGPGDQSERPDVHLKQAARSLRQGRPDEAVTHCREALRLDPDWAGANVMLGRALLRRREFEEAATGFHHALRVNPNQAEVYWQLGAPLREQGKLERSAAYLQRALRLQPGLAEAHHQLGLTLAEMGRADDAAAAYREALRLKPDLVLALGHLGDFLEERGQAEEGGRLVQEAIARAGPQAFPVHAHHGMSLLNQGRLEEARAHLRQALDLQPDFAATYYYLLARDGGQRLTEAEVARVTELLGRDGLPQRDRINLHFTLARTLDRDRAYDEAFGHCERGNACKQELLFRQGNAFHSGAHAQLIDRLRAACDRGFFERTRGFGDDSHLPVFIVGMPRSGTSLVEQILASHPAVFGAGELRTLTQFVTELPAALASSAEYPECLANLGPAESRLLAEQYLQDLRHRAGGRSRLSDKLPMNFHHLGLIAALFPRAALIHCRRDPCDVCWSCYFQNFRDVYFACDLRTLGAYHRQYERVMAHWREVLPVPVLEVCYEELVAEPERVSREIIAFCGLAWDDACLRSHETRRTVRTASNLQVRQPIYRGAVGYWKNYEPHLGPLLDALKGAGLESRL